MERPWCIVRSSQPPMLARPPQDVSDNGTHPQGPRPQPESRKVDPAEAGDEDRVRGAVGKGHRERRTRGCRGRLVLALERREDALAPIARIGRDVHGDRESRLDAAERGAKEAHRRHTHDLAVVDGERDDPLAGGVPLEPPGELLVRELCRPDSREERNERGALVGRVPDCLKAHLVAVPSAALNARRACVPSTVSFTEMRSQAPDRTSSNVRGGYGSML